MPYAANYRWPSPEQDRAAAVTRLASAVDAVLGPAPAFKVRAELAEGPAGQVLLDRAAGAELLVLGGSSRAESRTPAGGRSTAPACAPRPARSSGFSLPGCDEFDDWQAAPPPDVSLALP